MSYSDKINIYVPSDVGLILERDMQMFEVFKPNRIDFNWNRFLTLLIKGYYDTYVQENKAIHDRILSVLQDTPLTEKQRDDIATTVLRDVVTAGSGKRGGKGSKHLSLKPTEDTEGLIQRIVFESDDYISQSFRRMLISYSEKPISHRERIVFHDTYATLLQYCKVQQPICLTTIWNENAIHEVIPFAMAIGPEEMYNFLLCQEPNSETHQPEARAYALRRIKGVFASDKRGVLDATVHEHLLLMKKNGPQYAINDDEEIHVKLNEEGIMAYNRIYFGRPRYEKTVRVSDGELQYYRCSKDQVFLYFRRFDPTTVEILAPESLRERMRSFYESGVEVYKIQ